MWESRGSEWSSAQQWVLSQLIDYGSGLVGRPKVDSIVVGVCYRPHNQEEVEEVFFQTTGRSLMFAGPGLLGAVQPPWYLLQGQHSRAEAMQEVFGAHWDRLPKTGDWSTDEGRWSAWSHTYKQARTCQVCDRQGKLWLLQPANAGIQDPERWKQGKK